MPVVDNPIQNWQQKGLIFAELWFDWSLLLHSGVESTIFPRLFFAKNGYIFAVKNDIIELLSNIEIKVVIYLIVSKSVIPTLLVFYSSKSDEVAL